VLHWRESGHLALRTLDASTQLSATPQGSANRTLRLRMERKLDVEGRTRHTSAPRAVATHATSTPVSPGFRPR
jgi:hypothetical protein